MSIKIGNAPCSWGVEFAGEPRNPHWRQVLRENAEAGYTGIELGPVGYMPEDPVELSEALDEHGQELIGGVVFRAVHDPDQWEDVLDGSVRTCKALSAHGAQHLVLIDSISPRRAPTAGRHHAAEQMDAAEWAAYRDRIETIARIGTQDYGLTVGIHAHAAGFMDFEPELERLLEAARETETAAQNAATLSQARAALAQINNALGTGDPFADAITALQSSGAADIPSELTSLADDGVATLSELQGGVEEAARAGLAAARDASRGDEGLGGFLQRQLGARALSPKEGDDPDAVLSRIEPAVRSGDLEQALNEAEALPESAKSAMADWLDMLRTRHAAVTAADALTQRLNTN